MSDKLLVFSNCFGNSRFSQWNSSGGTLLGKKSIGCGINTLCFLGIFTKELGEHLVRNIVPNGTTFLEMLHYLNELSNINTIYTEHVYNLSTVDDVTTILNLIYKTIPDNSCTIVKLNRAPEFLGHTIVFSKENNVLYTIDPQDMKKWERIDDSQDLRIFNAWKGSNFISISLVYNSESMAISNSQLLLNNTSYTIANFPKVNSIKILQWSITDSQISNWKCLSDSPGEKNDCVLNSLSFLNVIERRYAKALSIQANKNKKQLSIDKIREELSKIKSKNTFIVFKYFNNIQDAILLLNDELLNNHGTLLLIRDSTKDIGHAVIIRKIGKYNYNIIDTQSQTIYPNTNDFITSTTFNEVVLVYNAGLVKSSVVTRKYTPIIRRTNITMRKSLKTPKLITHGTKVQQHILTKTEKRKQQRTQLIEERRKNMGSKSKKSFEFTPPNILSVPINSPSEKMDIN